MGAVLFFKNPGKRRSNIDLNTKGRIDIIEYSNCWTASMYYKKEG